jgi:hypothetical protein
MKEDLRTIDDLIVLREVKHQVHIGGGKIDKLDLDWDYDVSSKNNRGREFLSHWKPYCFYSSSFISDLDGDSSVFISKWHEWTACNMEEMSVGVFHLIKCVGDLRVLEIKTLEDSLILEDYLLSDSLDSYYNPYDLDLLSLDLKEDDKKILMRSKELLKVHNGLYKPKNWGRLKSICDCMFVDFEAIWESHRCSKGFSMDTTQLRRERGEEFEQAFGSRIDWSSYDCETYCWFNLDKLKIINTKEVFGSKKY